MNEEQSRFHEFHEQNKIKPVFITVDDFDHLESETKEELSNGRGPDEEEEDAPLEETTNTEG